MTTARVGAPDPDAVLAAFSAQFATRGLNDVGRETELSRLGLDSLVVTEIMLRVRQQFAEGEDAAEVPDDIPDLVTVGDLVDLVVEMVGG